MDYSFRLLDQSGSPCLLTSELGCILYTNPALSKLTQYSMNDMIGATPRLFSSGNTPRDVYTDLWSTITSGSCWRGELLNKKKTGEKYWESITISPIVNEKTGVVRYLGLLEDRTAAKRKAQERERLIDTLRSLGELHAQKLVPICSHCHSVRHSNEEWEAITSFLDNVLSVGCSHSICPTCLVRYYPGIT